MDSTSTNRVVLWCTYHRLVGIRPSENVRIGCAKAAPCVLHLPDKVFGGSVGDEMGVEKCCSKGTHTPPYLMATTTTSGLSTADLDSDSPALRL